MKVHFVSTGNDANVQLLKAGVKYVLLSYLYATGREQYEGFKHVMFDSGLFTLMWGAQAKKKFEEADAREWMAGYLEFINSIDLPNCSFVEMDVQKKLGPELAWDLRRELRAKSKHRIVNVYHLEDGNPDKLIEFSDYIAVSQPELRKGCTKAERLSINRYIGVKAQAKGKQVHLLGLAEKKLLNDFSWCDTSDTTSWSAVTRFGSIIRRGFPVEGVGRVNKEQLQKSYSGEKTAMNDLYWAAVLALKNYRKYAGDQN